MSTRFYKLLLPAISGLAGLAVALAADAHGGLKPEHGGVLQVTGETSFELVNSPGGVALFVEEDEEEVPSSGMTATLAVTTKAGETSTVALAPAGDNKFEAKGVTIAPGSTVGVMVVDKATQARSSTTFALK